MSCAPQGMAPRPPLSKHISQALSATLTYRITWKRSSAALKRCQQLLKTLRNLVPPCAGGSSSVRALVSLYFTLFPCAPPNITSPPLSFLAELEALG